MTAIILMAKALDTELQKYDVFLTRTDCEAIIAAVLEKSANAANTARLTRQQAEDLTKRWT